MLESVPVSVVCVAGGQYDLHAAYGQLKAEETARVVGEPWLHVDTNIITPRHLVDRSSTGPPPPLLVTQASTRAQLNIYFAGHCEPLGYNLATSDRL